MTLTTFPSLFPFSLVPQWTFTAACHPLPNATTAAIALSLILFLALLVRVHPFILYLSPPQYNWHWYVW
jgi:hypothetical protein